MSTFTRGSPSTPKSRPSRELIHHRVHALGRDAPCVGHAGHLPVRGVGRDLRVEPAAEAVTSSAGTGPGALGFSFCRRATSPTMRSRSFCDVGEKLEPEDAVAS